MWTSYGAAATGVVLSSVTTQRADESDDERQLQGSDVAESSVWQRSADDDAQSGRELFWH